MGVKHRRTKTEGMGTRGDSARDPAADGDRVAT